MAKKEITIPFAYTPRSYQLDFLAAPQRFKIAVFHRRAGKSKTVLNQQIAKALKTKGVYYYFLPTYRQAKAVCWDALVKEHVPPEVVDKINDSELAVYYKNGSIQRFVGCEDIDKHRGINPLDVVFDEYSEMNEKIWTAIIQPVLRENKGTATFIFTPKGMNHAWKLIQMAKENPSEWFISIKGVDDTNVFTKEELQEIGRNTPKDLFEQEYYCKFVEGGASFFKRVDENVWSDDWKPKELAMYQIGVDLAKFHDYTVITQFDLSSFRILKQERFNQMDYNLQKAKIENIYLKSNRGRVIIDSTGVGEPVYDDLYARGINVEPFRFNQKSRMDLLRNLQIKLEQDRIKIPNDPILIAELKSMQYTLSPAGNLTVQVPDGSHDDMIMSLALAVWNSPENPIHVNQFTNSNQTEGVQPMYPDFGI